MAKAVKLGKGVASSDSGLEVLTIPEGTQLPISNGKTGTKYPWEKWFSGSALVIRKGRDYNVLTAHMFPKIKTAARKRYKICIVQSRDLLGLLGEKGAKLDNALIIMARDMMADEVIAEDKKRTEEKVRREELDAEKLAAGEAPTEPTEDEVDAR